MDGINEAFFLGKKFVVVAAGAQYLASRNLALTSAMIGLQFGRKVPEMVGRDQNIPSGQGASRRHLGITTQNLPVLEGGDFEKMRAFRESLKGETDLLITEVTDAVATSATYAEYAQARAATPDSRVNYWGIGVYGDAEIVDKYTQAQGFKLYGKQSKLPNSDSTTPTRRLIGDRSDLPKFNLVLANNLAGGVLANTAMILGATFGKLYGDSLFGPDLCDADGRSILALPWIDMEIFHGSSDTARTIRELREKLHNGPDALSVVDVTDATGRTRNYSDYLAIAETTSVSDTPYWGVGISGPDALVAQQTAGLAAYITSAEEKDALTKAAGAQKLAARQAAAASAKGAGGMSEEQLAKKLEKERKRAEWDAAESARKQQVGDFSAATSVLTQVAAQGGLGWQQNNQAAPTSELGAQNDVDTGFRPNV